MAVQRQSRTIKSAFRLFVVVGLLVFAHAAYSAAQHVHYDHHALCRSSSTMGRFSAVKVRMVRRNNFQVGNIPWNRGVRMERGHARTEDPAVASCSSRSPDLDPVDQQSESTHTAPFIDVKKRLDEDTYKMLYKPGDHVIIPRLRISKTKCYTYRRSYTKNQVRGNRIIDMQRLEELVSLFIAGHQKANGKKVCKAGCKFSGKLEKMIGLGCMEALECKSCGYKTTPEELFQRADSRRPGARGPLPVKTNFQVVTPGAKDRYGISAIKPLMASMNIKDPSRTTLQKKMNVASETYEKLNEEQMEKNRSILAEVKRLRIKAGLKESATVAVESDVGYNNPPKGRSRGQPGTQAECPMFEKDTDKNMIVALSTENQHCRGCDKLAEQGLPSGPGSHEGCTRTIDKHVKLGCSEKKMAKQNTKTALQSGLQVGISCNDNDGKILDGTNEALREAGLPPAEKQDCVQHNTRNHRNKVFNLCLDVFAGGKNTKKAREEASRRVGHYIVKRCNSALYTARRHHPDSDVDFFRELESLRPTIVNCIAGEHSKCTYEFGCPEYISESRRPAPDIPGGGNLALSEDDRYALQNLVDYRLAPETVKRQRKLWSANKSEAVHNRALKAVPKAVTWKRNYKGRVHAAALMRPYPFHF
uniref:Mutator-like transposase domain-containing protein n=1 Tax=Branchiostoma floridae TaxID=7739 RepID=C3Y0X0_BRAFL|eukprot:XP_002610093.1 hypothetical protein BRAFLDRAFT_125654 [Branchiostoma floridae]